MPETDINHLQNLPGFLLFVELYQTRYPHVRSGSMLRFSLAPALQQLGLACLVGGQGSKLAASAAEILDGLDKAIRSTASRRLHLCPLDLASRLPAISFGPNQVRRFSAAELEELFDVLRLHRVNENWSFDSGRFSQFNWLVVSEEVRHNDMGPEGRRLAGLFVDLSQDFGRIDPYKTGLPPAVEAAVDLMARTVYLKVSNHGSENATPDKSGLGPMSSPDLSAFIPTNKNDAMKVRWGAMPYDAILRALSTKTGGRVSGLVQSEFSSQGNPQRDSAFSGLALCTIRDA